MSSEEHVRLVRPHNRISGDPTPGMQRELAISTDRSWAGFVTTGAGMVSGWHHHGDYESHVYVLSGGLRVESGPGGAHVIEAEPGDFVFIPAHVIHREQNPTDTDAAVIVVRTGSGESVVNVDGPQGGKSP